MGVMSSLDFDCPNADDQLPECKEVVEHFDHNDYGILVYFEGVLLKTERYIGM